MWMGGDPPLGYPRERAHARYQPCRGQARAPPLRAIYLQLGCVRRVKDEVDRLGLKTKRSTTTNGAERGSKPFSRGHIYRLLSNLIYTGRIAHKGQLYPGQHQALIADEIWTAVRSQLAGNARRPSKPS